MKPVILRFLADKSTNPPTLSAEVLLNGNDDSEIEATYAFLGLKCFHSMIENDVMTGQYTDADIAAAIAISRSHHSLDTAGKLSLFNSEQGDYDDTTYLSTQEFKDLEMTVGFSLFVSNTDIIGGMSTSPVVAASSVFDFLTTVRDTCAIPQDQ